MEPQRGWIMQRTPSTHPPTHRLTNCTLLWVWGFQEMYGECLEGILKCLEGVWICVEGVWICLEGVWNVPEGVWKVFTGFLNIFPLNVVRCPHPNYSPINKVCAVSPPPSICFLPTQLFPPSVVLCFCVCNAFEGVWKVSEGFPNISSFNVVQCSVPTLIVPPNMCGVPRSQFMFSPHPNCSLHQESMCGVPLPVCVFSPLCPPPCSSVLLPHLAQPWILSKV